MASISLLCHLIVDKQSIKITNYILVLIKAVVVHLALCSLRFLFHRTVILHSLGFGVEEVVVVKTMIDDIIKGRYIAYC